MMRVLYYNSKAYRNGETPISTAHWIQMKRNEEANSSLFLYKIMAEDRLPAYGWQFLVSQKKNLV